MLINGRRRVFGKIFNNIKISNFTRRFNYNDKVPTFYENKNTLEEASKEYSEMKFSYNVNFIEDVIESASFENLLTIMKQLIAQNKKDFDTWYKCLDKFNTFLCDHQVSKADLIEFLSVLDHFRPKLLEKHIIPDSLTQVGSQTSISSKHEEEYFRIRAPRDPLVRFASFLKKHVSENMNKILKIDFSKHYENRENMKEGIDDLIGIYNITFSNIEKKIIDDITHGRVPYSAEECVDILKSFSRNSQGTNMFYEVLMRKISKNVNTLTIYHAEILLNYIPHELYNNLEDEKIKYQDDVIEKGRDMDITKFYNHIFNIIVTNIDKADDRLFINLWQGALRIRNIDVNLINTFLIDFERRITDKEKDKKFYFDFLQILGYFIKAEYNDMYYDQIEFNIIYKIIKEPFLNKYIDTFDLKEIATIFWLFFHYRILSKETIMQFEVKIRTKLLSYLNDPKSKIDSMGYETDKRYFDNHNIDPYDVEAIQFFLSTIQYKGPLNDIIKKALQSIELENTHPISRKTFHL